RIRRKRNNRRNRVLSRCRQHPGQPDHQRQNQFAHTLPQHSVIAFHRGASCSAQHRPSNSSENRVGTKQTRQKTRSPITSSCSLCPLWFKLFLIWNSFLASAD